MSCATPLKVGILGVGAIGRVIAQALDAHELDAELVALADKDRERAETLAGELRGRPPVVGVEEMIERCELAVEAASQAVLPEFVPKALARGRDVLVMSVGGLLGRAEWFREAAAKNCRIYVPSGAIAGLDGIKSASIGRIEKAQLTSRKPVAALAGSKYVADRGLRLAEFTEETVIFEGTAEEAARAFPATSNVAASLRLAVDAAVPVRVRVVAVPGGNENVHEIRVCGEFGKLMMRVENVPSKSNPKTSQLAAFSAVATLKNLTQALRVGT
jgi:aspartate dehydrogenase